MKLTEIKISGYKSIDSLVFPIKKYGASYTTILLGKNETGKSNVLDAFSLLAKMRDGAKVNFSSVKKQVDPEPDIVSVSYAFEPEDTLYRDFVAEKISIPDAIANKIKIIKATEEVRLQDGCDQYSREWAFSLEPGTLESVCYKQNHTTGNSGNVQKSYSIKFKKDLDEEDAESYFELDWEIFSEIIQPALEEYFDENEVPVSAWRAKDSDLVQDNISLKEFSKDPSLYPSLKNMFALSGFADRDQIQRKVQEIETSSNLRRKLEKKLSDDSSKYINSKWKEHKIKIDVNISDELNTHIKIQDQDNTDCYYNMQDRSEGFKQFVSLLLSISIRNQSGDIKNNLIVIDEPEVHLHPSGVRYMLEELLKIGKNNYVFLATHSNFMVDNRTKERHFLLTKEHGITHAKQITSDAELFDDEILQTAFGIDTIRDFLSPYKLLLEGASDKIILQRALKQVDSTLDVRISNGSGANIVAVASKLAFSDISALVVVDDDEAGQRFKKDTLKIKDNFSEKNVFTIRDLNGSLKPGSTIEDTLPNDYLLAKTNEILSDGENNLPKIETIEETPFSQQLIEHLQIEISKDKTLSKHQQKEKINKIVNDVKANISSSYNEKNIETKAPLLYALAQAIVDKLRKIQ